MSERWIFHGMDWGYPAWLWKAPSGAALRAPRETVLEKIQIVQLRLGDQPETSDTMTLAAVRKNDYILYTI